MNDTLRLDASVGRYVDARNLLLAIGLVLSVPLNLVTTSLDFSDVSHASWAVFLYVGSISIALTLGLIAVFCFPRLIIITNINRSKHVLALCGLILASQLSIGAIYGFNSAQPITAGVGYVIIIAISFFLIPLWFRSRRFTYYFFGTLAAIGVISTFVGLIASLGHVTSVLGISVENAEFIDVLGIPSTQAMYRQRSAYGTQVFLGCLGSAYLMSVARLRSIGVLCLVICLVGVFISWGRAVWIATIVAGFVWRYLGSSKKQRRFFLLSGALLLSVFVVAFFQSSFVQKLFIVERGISGREILWPVAISAISARPLLGYGIGEQSNVKLDFGDDDLNQFLEDNKAGFHNFILDTSVAMGIPVAITIVIVILGCLWKLRRWDAEIGLKRTVAAGIVGMTIISFFTPYNVGGVRNPSLVFTILLGVANISPILWARFKHN